MRALYDKYKKDKKSVTDKMLDGNYSVQHIFYEKNSSVIERNANRTHSAKIQNTPKTEVTT